MRLRTFIAPSIGEAMRQVRTALGEDAVILSTEQEGKQVKVTAAIETQAASNAAAPAVAEGSDELEAVLRYHGVPQALASRLLATAAGLEGSSSQQALTAALRAQFGFQPMTDRKPAKPILLAGLPGAGKSSTLAKLAARAKVNGLPVTAITCDLAKAGATRLVATKIDVARRYGGLLAAAEAGRLAFAGVGTSPEIASGLGTLRADQLCRLILPASRAESRAPGSADGKSPNSKSMSGIA
jgi:flagellar biosynthesis protein FlhF